MLNYHVIPAGGEQNWATPFSLQLRVLSQTINDAHVHL